MALLVLPPSRAVAKKSGNGLGSSWTACDPNKLAAAFAPYKNIPIVERCAKSDRLACGRIPEEERHGDPNASESRCRAVYEDMVRTALGYEKSAKELCENVSAKSQECQAKIAENGEGSTCWGEAGGQLSNQAKGTVDFLNRAVSDLRNRQVNADKTARVVDKDWLTYQNRGKKRTRSSSGNSGMPCFPGPVDLNPATRNRVLEESLTPTAGSSSTPPAVELRSAIKEGERFISVVNQAIKEQTDLANGFSSQSNINKNRGKDLNSLGKGDKPKGSDVTGTDKPPGGDTGGGGDPGGGGPPEDKGAGGGGGMPKIPEIPGGGGGGGEPPPGSGGMAATAPTPDSFNTGAPPGSPGSAGQGGGRTASGNLFNSGNSVQFKPPKSDSNKPANDIASAPSTPGAFPSYSGDSPTSSASSSRGNGSKANRAGASGGDGGGAGGGGSLGGAGEKKCIGKEECQVLNGASSFGASGALGGGEMFGGGGGGGGDSSGGSLDSLFKSDNKSAEGADGAAEGGLESIAGLDESAGGEEGGAEGQGSAEDIPVMESGNIFERVHTYHVRAQKRGLIMGLKKKL